MTIRIKLCGLKDPQTALYAVDLGVDAIGLNFVPHSPRGVSLPEAQAISAAVGDRTLRVGLFADPEAADVEAVLQALPLDWLQFHGAERPVFCRAFGLPYLKALAPAAGPVAEQAKAYSDARGWLVDSVSADGFGGTGHRFDWRLWPTARERTLVASQRATSGVRGDWFLAGGLDPDNVGDAIQRLQPDWVDVSSGIEGPVRGEKDRSRMARFVEATRRADEELAQTL